MWTLRVIFQFITNLHHYGILQMLALVEERHKPLENVTNVPPFRFASYECLQLEHFHSLQPVWDPRENLKNIQVLSLLLHHFTLYMHIFFLLHVYWFVNSCSNWFNLNTLYCSFKTIGLGTIQKDMYCIIALALPNSISENL